MMSDKIDWSEYSLTTKILTYSCGVALIIASIGLFMTLILTILGYIE